MPAWIDSIVDILKYWIPIINIVLAIAIIFLERRNVGVTWAWLMLLLLLPFLGFIIYIFLGQNLSRQKVYKLKPRSEAMLRHKALSQMADINRGTFVYEESTVREFESLIVMNMYCGSSPLSQNNRIDLFTDGKEKFASLLRAISEAEDHIHLLYYKIANDETTRTLVNALTMKAVQGVQVRLMYDDIGSSGVKQEQFDQLIAAGGEVQAFFPSRIPYLNFRMNYRNHRKIAIIDGRIGYIGGFNIGDEYLGLNRKIGYWRDTHLRITGDAVQRLQVQFFLDWSVSAGGFIQVHPNYFPPSTHELGAAVQIVSSGPNSEEQQIKYALIKLIYEARAYIYIQTPYFIPDESVMTALKIAAMSGIDVRIMIPEKGDNWLVHRASYAYIGELFRSGAKIYLYEKGFLHAKTIVIDGKAASVGTANMDRRSFELNFEINAFIYDPSFVNRLVDIYEQDIVNSKLLNHEKYGQRSFVNRMGESMARLLSPIL
jgi:cardiolipin synthase